MLLDQRRPAVFLPVDPPREGRRPDGQWYRLARSGTTWDLDAAPDPAALLAGPDASTVTR